MDLKIFLTNSLQGGLEKKKFRIFPELFSVFSRTSFINVDKRGFFRKRVLKTNELYEKLLLMLKCKIPKTEEMPGFFQDYWLTYVLKKIRTWQDKTRHASSLDIWSVAIFITNWWRCPARIKNDKMIKNHILTCCYCAVEQKGHGWTSSNENFDWSTVQNMLTVSVLSFVGLLWLINRMRFPLLGDNDLTNQKPFFYNVSRSRDKNVGECNLTLFFTKRFYQVRK